MEKQNDDQKWINYNRAIGNRYSAMEHLVPEQMFSTEEAPAEGVSAVKALAIAAAEGQRIYTINASNVEQVLGSVSLGTETEQEIRNAAYAGKEITTHHNQIDFYGWIGEGYIILDPETGAGAYKIAGGENGGLLKGVGYILNALGLFYGVLSAIAATLGPAVPLLNKIVQFIEIARFVHSLLTAGINCSSALDAVLFFLTVAAILSLLIAQLALLLWNPLAAFAAGVVIDLGFSALVSASEDCS